VATNGRSVLVGAKTFSENPRYLLARKQLWRVFREDYFAVPDVLARKKEFAEFFAKRWGRLGAGTACLCPLVGSLRFAGFAANRSYLTLLRFLISRKLDSQSCAQRPGAPRPEMVF